MKPASPWPADTCQMVTNKAVLGEVLWSLNNFLSQSCLHSKLLRKQKLYLDRVSRTQAFSHAPHCGGPRLPRTAFKLLLFLPSATADLSGRYLFSSYDSDSSFVVFTVGFTLAWRSKPVILFCSWTVFWESQKWDSAHLSLQPLTQNCPPSFSSSPCHRHPSVYELNVRMAIQLYVSVQKTLLSASGT